MSYNYPQSPPQQNNGWGQPTPPISPYSNGQPYPAAPTPTIDAAALSPHLQPAYQAPQFAPPPPQPKPQSGSVLKALNFFSTKPSYQQQANTGESSLSGPITPPVGNNIYSSVPGPQQYGTVGGQPVQTSPPAPAVYNPAQTAAPLSPIPAYNPAAPAGQHGQPGNVPVYQNPAVANPAPVQQQYQPQQPQPQPQQPQQPQHPQQVQQPQQPQHPQQLQQPQQQYQQPQKPQQPQQPHQQHQQPTHNNSYPSSASAGAPPPAYAPGPAGAQAWPEKPTIQSHQAGVPAAAAPTPSTAHPGQANGAPQTQVAMDNTGYWKVLVDQGIIPLAPKPQLRSLFRGIAACINKECALDKTPQCVLSPAKMSMYYGMQSGYNSRESQLFSRAQVAPTTLTTLYSRLNVEYVLIPSNAGDGRRKPHSPALTITGFEHWLLLNALLNPDAEHQRISKFISQSGRLILDDQGRPFPSGGFPRGALPAGPDSFVVKRYGGWVEEALASTAKSAREEELAEDEGLRKEIEGLKKALFEQKSELESSKSELKKKDSELERSNAELGRVTELLAKSTAAADEAVTKMATSWGVGVAQEERRQQQQQYQQQQPLQSPYSAYLPSPQQQQGPGFPPHSPAQQRRQSEQVWAQKPQDQYPPQQQRGQSGWPQQPGNQHPQQQQPQQPEQPQQQPTYYRQQYQPAR